MRAKKASASQNTGLLLVRLWAAQQHSAIVSWPDWHFCKLNSADPSPRHHAVRSRVALDCRLPSCRARPPPLPCARRQRGGGLLGVAATHESLRSMKTLMMIARESVVLASPRHPHRAPIMASMAARWCRVAEASWLQGRGRSVCTAVCVCVCRISRVLACLFVLGRRPEKRMRTLLLKKRFGPS